MNRQAMKAHLIDNIIVAMSYHFDNGLLQVLERVLTEELANVTVDLITTLPAEMKDSINEQNRYIIQLFLYKKKKLTNGTKYNYLSAIKKLLLLVDKPLTEMDESDIYRYLNWYEYHDGRKAQASTVNNERRYLNAFYEWMRKEKLVAENPVEGIEPLKVIRKPIDYFSLEDIAKLRDGCRTWRERALVEVLRSTGARVGEIVAITVDMIDWNTGDILILSEKGGRYRTIYLDAEAKHHYKKYLQSRTDRNPSMFVHERKPYRTLSPCGVRIILKGIAERAGVEGRVYPHKMRKTLGMTLKNRGVDIGTIQEILGHASPDVTAAYYAQSTPTTLRQVREHTAA